MITQEMLLNFCAVNDCREFLNAPFSNENYIYACDGAIAIRLNKSEFTEIAETNHQVVYKVIDKHLNEAIKDNFKKLDNLPSLIQETCNDCDGSGVYTECPECYGDGELECDLGHTHECERCDGAGKNFGSGDNQCSKCRGTGKISPYTPIKIGLGYIDLKYALLINSLPDAEIAELTITDNRPPVYFKFKGGEGVLAQVRAPKTGDA